MAHKQEQAQGADGPLAVGQGRALQESLSCGAYEYGFAQTNLPEEWHQEEEISLVQGAEEQRRSNDQVRVGQHEETTDQSQERWV